jgi:AMIN domain-containing protein
MMNRSHQRSIARCRTVAAIAMLCMVTAYVEGFAQDAQTPVPILRAVRVDAGASGGATTVILEADGPLPVPVSGALDGPPRIYLDLNGVRPGTAVRLAEPGALVLRARVGLHGANPISTRVVLDLSRPSPYRIDSSGRAQGRLTVVLDVPSSASAPAPPPVQTHTQAKIPSRATPPPSAAPAPAPVAPAPSPSVSGSPAAPQRRASGGDAYVAQVSVALGRLQALRPLLASIDRRAPEPVGDLRAAILEFNAVARILVAIKVPTSRETTQDLLLRACDLGARASRMRMEVESTGDLAPGWNAASAAAGALIMLDSASADLGSVGPK